MKRKLDSCNAISSDLCKSVASGREVAPPDRCSTIARDDERPWFREYSPKDYERVFQAAIEAGNKAAAAVTPPMMIVVDHDRMIQATHLEDVQMVWIDPGGPIGYAHITVRPATHPFSRWLLKQNLATRIIGQSGIVVRASCNSQSIHKAAAHALAVVRVIGHAQFGVRIEITLRYD